MPHILKTYSDPMKTGWICARSILLVLASVFLFLPLTSPEPAHAQALLERRPHSNFQPDADCLQHRRVVLHFQTRFRVEKALFEIEKYTNHYPNDPWGYLHRGEVLSMMERYSEADESIAKAVSLGAEPVDAQLVRARNYVFWGKGEQAKACYEKALNLSPNSANVNYQAGVFYAAAEDYDRAEQLLRAALASRPGDPETLEALAGVLDSQSRHDEALEYYEKSITGRLEPPEESMELAKLYQKRGLYEKAAEAIRRLSADQLKQAEAALLLAQALNGSGKWQEALEVLDSAIGRYPRHVGLLLEQARAWRWMKEKDKALQAYARVLQVDADNAEAMFDRARIYSETGRLEQAVAEAARAAEQRPGNMKIQALQAAVYHSIGKEDKARSLLARAGDEAEAENMFQFFLSRIQDEQPAENK
jgi:tetratricopeptide (TPR) repeat protein